MSTTNETALHLIGDQVRTALQDLHHDLKSLIGLSPVKYQNLLLECEGKIHTISGAFDVASLEVLSRYTQALQAAVHYLREASTAPSRQALATIIAAEQSLYDFLQITPDKKSTSELALFQDYSRLGDLMSHALSPFDLWHQKDSLRCLERWMQADVVAELHAQIEHRFSFYDVNAIDPSRVDGLMLALIRHQQAQAAQDLKMICDWRGRKQEVSSPTHCVCAALLSIVIEAFAAGHLDLDIFLKRYLLASLSWLKLGKSDDTFINQSIFFSHLAWQAQNDAEYENPAVLDILAKSAGWKPQRGTHYSTTRFDEQARHRMQQAHEAIANAKKTWHDFCLVDPVIAKANQLPILMTSFDQMGQTLRTLHPASNALNQALDALVSNESLRTQHHVQVEIATLLLILDPMLGDMDERDAAQTESRFAALARRLNALKNSQAAGAFEPWMLQLQQQQDLLQAMTSTTEQLGQKLTEIESVFERAWRDPNDKSELAQVPAQLRQINAIASSLKLDDFAHAIQPVEEKLKLFVEGAQPMNESAQKDIAADMASLGLMLTMWAHKPELIQPKVIATRQVESPQASPALLALEGKDADADADEPIEHVFLTEAQDVLTQASDEIARLAQQADDRQALVGLRRAFHTLKGSARIVGLVDYGESAWLIEQNLNKWLVETKAVPIRLLEVCSDRIHLMREWTTYLQTQQSFDALALDWQLDPLRKALQDIDPLKKEEIQIKVIEHLQISLPLYQAYLNEADEWSRLLALALAEWSLDDEQPIPNQTLTWAHALAGSSATIGFESCAALAKLLERVIGRIQDKHYQDDQLSKTLLDGANDIRHLLHQFAAGFLKTADPLLIERLNAHLQQPLPETTFIAQAPLPTANHAIDGTSIDAQMKAVFDEESAQLLPELGAALRTWDKAKALRALHTLKGSARLVGEQTLAGRAHDLESQIEGLGDQPTEEQLAKILQSYDQLAGASQPLALAPSPLLTPLSIAVAQPSRIEAFVPTVSGETIRVQSHTVDRLVNQTGELMIARSRMEAEMVRSLRTLSDMGIQVQRLRDQLREMELQTESQMQSRQAQVTDASNNFDPLELDRFTRTQELTRFMAEALSDISTLQRSLQRSLNTAEDDLSAQLRQTRDLQRNLLRTRMVEFDSAGERLHRLVRMTSQELGKTVDLIIQNGGQEMDRSVLERMLPAFEHLLRNAVVHGIEPPDEREKKGKPAHGKITISLTQQSNDVIVNLTDDGRGINQQALLMKARVRLKQPNFHADASDLIFMSGLSTASEVSELAGRGIGMDVVRSQILALGGRIEVTSTENIHTAFKLILPLTTAVTQVVLVRTGAQMTGIPGHLVSTIVRVKPEQIEQARQSQSFMHGDQAYRFFGLSQLLSYKLIATGLEQATQTIMLLQSAGQTIALQVDEVLGNQEVMVKNLGAQLAQMPGLSGMTVLPTGPTVLIYNPVALAAVYGPRLLDSRVLSETTQSIPSKDSIPDLDKTDDKAPLVLVVDDSITMRRVLQRLLQREGYRVAVAADGQQALEALRAELPALVLSDVEMPRMDGFELLRSIRTSDKLQKLPVVMITSRIADKHRDHAKELGANEYLGKPYSEDELLKILARYAAKAK